MVRRTIEQRIAELDAKKKSLLARQRKQERAKDTRRKILVGALVLDRAARENDKVADWLNAWLARELPGFLTRDIDRALFHDWIGNAARNDSEEGREG